MGSKYNHIDAESLVSSLLPCSIDVTITSPPYGSLKNYGAKGQIGFGQPYSEYLGALTRVFRLLHSRTKETGSLWIVADTFKEKSQVRLLPFDLAARLKRTGWILQDVVIWNKTKTLPWSRRGQFRRTFEYVLFFTKTRDFKYFIDRIKEPDDLKEWWVKYPERYSPEGKVPTAIWSFPIPVQGSWSKTKFRHFCPFPAELVERILSLTTDPKDRVLDPFAGSGVVLAQAKVMGRKFVGGDVNKAYQTQFYRVIADHIGQKWAKNKKLLQETDATRRHLAQTIRSLRQVKFPKALFKEVRKLVGPADASHIKAILAKAVALNGRSSRHCFSRLFVYFLCDEGAPIPLIEREGRKLAQKPPLSKYGISAEIHARPADQFWRTRDGCLLTGQKVFLYLEGITHHPQEEIRISESSPLTLRSWKRIPPIATNVEVRQKLIRTWAPAEPGL